MMSMPLFKQVTEMLQLRDSVDDHYSHEKLMNEIKDAEEELIRARQKYYEKLSLLRTNK